MVRLCISEPVLLFSDAPYRILDTFDACLTSHTVYHYLVTNYMNPKSIATPVWCVTPRSHLGCGNSYVVQEFDRESLCFDRSTFV